jgi:peptidoglycan/xylan/chitin deacetylase (PgdA/CDA1 family)
VTPIPVLVYHRVGPVPPGHPHPDTFVPAREFDRQLAALRALGYESVSAEEYEAALDGRAPKARKPVLITFDDGSATTLTQAAPILERRGFSAVLFMVTESLGRPAGWDGETEDGGHRQLTDEELKKLLELGWTIGSHTRTHPRLDSLDDAALEAEISGSKAQLERLLGREVAWFAYPYGRHDERVAAAARRGGYKLAFATETGTGGRYSVPRRVINGRGRIWKFLWRLRQAGRLARA